MAQIQAWEALHGVTLPEPLRTALALRDGGMVRKAGFSIHPLAEIVPVEDDFWEWCDLEAEEVPDRSLLFEWGLGDATMLMNFNEAGPHGSPSVYLDFHGEQCLRVGDSMVAFFEAELAADAEPTVRWADAENRLGTIARVTVKDEDPDVHEPAVDQILIRDRNSLVVFSHERFADGERLTRTTLPMPLDAEMARIHSLRPGSDDFFVLHLQSSDPEATTEEESTRDEDGLWKNSSTEGTPSFYVQIQANDRARLEAIRIELVGAEAAKLTRSNEERDHALAANLAGMPTAERQAAMVARMLDLLPAEERAALLSGSVDQAVQQVADRAAADGIPPELAEAAMAVRRRFAEAMARMQNSPNPG